MHTRIRISYDIRANTRAFDYRRLSVLKVTCLPIYLIEVNSSNGSIKLKSSSRRISSHC